MNGGALYSHGGESQGIHFSYHMDYGTHVHELGHQLESNVLIDADRARNKDLYDKAKKRDEASTSYALTSAKEYFAENCAFYIHAPRVLEEIDPEAYQFMQEFFQ